MLDKSNLNGWRLNIHEVIYETSSPAGKFFDVTLIVAIALSIIVVMLESVAAVRMRYSDIILILEWCFTLLFTIEYVLRIVCVGKPAKYIFSFFGLVDLVAILPTYFSLILPGGHYFLMVRVLRILRIFRVLKLVLYMRASETILRALRASGRKIAVFIFAVLTIVIIVGSLMYLIEGEKNGYTSIPRSIYWAIVTLTTVGYGDIAPKTNLGQILAAVLMILGYSIIAVPTGIVSVEMADAMKKESKQRSCPSCGKSGHDADASHCKWCGTTMN
ncbi:MAG: ion transporter [Candidatus Electryonea clarkiae]|nr:ion transporter [Candidatus Electryonea clarkiae]MDP8287732.1 ion transporter [Candidatus Electryonea clarkiae]